MPSIHDDKEFPGAAYRRGLPGDVRQGTCYGYRSASEYNRIKVRTTELEEGRPVSLFYHMPELKNDNYICRFVVVNGHLDPGMRVCSRVPSPTLIPAAVAGDPALGTLRLVQPDVLQEWLRLEEDGRYTFYPPDSYQGGGLVWFHDDRLLEESLVYEQTTNYLFLSALRPTHSAGLAELAELAELAAPLTPLTTPAEVV